MNPAEVTAALNRNTEAINALAKSFQRDPYKEFIDGGVEKPSARANRFIEVLTANNATMSDMTKFGRSCTELIFGFATPPKVITISYLNFFFGTGTGPIADLNNIAAVAAFSNDRANWTKNFFLPQITAPNWYAAAANYGMLTRYYECKKNLSYQFVRVTVTDSQVNLLNGAKVLENFTGLNASNAGNYSYISLTGES